jgi:hypothetical protein
MKRAIERRAGAPLLVLGLVLAEVGAAQRSGPSGRVVDEAGAPVTGAAACLVVAGAEVLCDATDVEGRYALPASEAVSVRIAASGYMPINVAAVSQASPVVLERAASLKVRVVDAVTGEGLAASEVTLVYSGGRQFGPFPANQAGLSLPTLPPGEVRAVGRAEGYAETTGETVTLVRGRKTELRLALRRAPDASKK